MKLRFILFWLPWIILSSCTALPPPYPPTVQAPAYENKAERLFLEAETFFRRQEYRQAYQVYSTYLQQHPQGPYSNTARLRQAEILGFLGDWYSSLTKYQEIFNRGAEGDTALAARYGIGRAYFKLGRYQSAIEVLEGLSASNLPGPLRFSTNALLAELALKTGEIEPAFVRLRLAAKDLPAGDQEWFDYLKSRVVEQASPAELKHLANLYRDSPLTAPILLRLARLAQEEGRPEEARKWLQVLKERFPESREAQAKWEAPVASQPVIGCLLPLSGNFAEYGNRVKQGMELAAKGTRLELVYRNCPNDPAQAARTVQELSQDPRVLALLGPLTSADAPAAAQAAQTAGIPLIALSQKQNLTEAGPLIFQIFLTPQLQVRALLRYTLGSKGLSRYAMFCPDSPYGRTLSQVFDQELLAQGGILVTQATYQPGTQDFTMSLSPLLMALQPGMEGESSFDALFIPDDAGTLAAIASQLSQHPSGKVLFLGTNLSEPQKLSAEATKALEGTLFPTAFFINDPNPAVQSFVASYRQRYGTDPDYLSVQGYMVVRLIHHLLESQSLGAREEIPQKLLTLRDIPNFPWFKGFAPNRQAELAFYILTIRDGRVEMITSPAASLP